VAIGTETDGSIVCPGGANGVPGFKPSVGLISRAGVVPVTGEQDTPGPMARHVVDLAIAMSVLQGRDADDPATTHYPDDQIVDYPAALDPNALRGARIGYWHVPNEAAAVRQSTMDTLAAAGAVVVPVSLPYQDEIGTAELPAMWAEFRHDLEVYLATRTGAPRTFAELIAFNKNDPVELSRFGQDHLERAADSPSLSDPDHRRRRALATELARKSIDETMAAERLDVIVAPTNDPAWPIDYAAGDRDDVSSSSPAAVAGYPTATVPAGFAGHLPIGVSFIAGRFADARVLAFAAAFERAAGARRPPRYLPTID
jgi:amidase